MYENFYKLGKLKKGSHINTVIQWDFLIVWKEYVRSSNDYLSKWKMKELI